jgi:hypothetical protein
MGAQNTYNDFCRTASQNNNFCFSYDIGDMHPRHLAMSGHRFLSSVVEGENDACSLMANHGKHRTCGTSSLVSKFGVELPEMVIMVRRIEIVCTGPIRPNISSYSQAHLSSFL